MAKNRLFIPQETLDVWIEEGRARVDDNELTLTEEDKRYILAPAVHFVREATGAEDPHHLVSRVKEETQLTILGADAYMDSVILDDNAYDVKRGFAAIPTAANKPAAVDKPIIAEKQKEKTSEPPADEQAGTNDTSDALAALLLQNLK
jgi:hypothetical protein